MRLSFFICCLLLVLAGASASAQKFNAEDPRSLQELPQIFYKQGDTVIKWIEAGALLEISSQQTADFAQRVIQLEGRFGVPLRAALQYGKGTAPKQAVRKFEGVQKWLAISDIHGQYGLMVELLRKHGVLDEDLNWAFGRGHLVINGDILDRGEGATEGLWLAFKLQQQAAAAGGRVHYNMGNHELMVLDNDLRYIHEKYKVAAEVLGETYHAQFSTGAFFGQWLRQQSVMFQINETGFVHAGISPELVKMGLKPEDINRIFADSIFTQAKDEYRKSEQLKFLATTNGPVWYRGYFNDEPLAEADLQAIFGWWGIERMVIGHTSQRQIVPLFDGRIFAIDSSIKNGRNGEVLIYNHGVFFRGLLDGSRVAAEAGD